MQRTRTSFCSATDAIWPCTRIAMVCRTFQKDSGSAVDACKVLVDLLTVCCAQILAEHLSKPIEISGRTWCVRSGYQRSASLTQYFLSRSTQLKRSRRRVGASRATFASKKSERVFNASETVAMRPSTWLAPNKQVRINYRYQFYILFDRILNGFCRFIHAHGHSQIVIGWWQSGDCAKNRLLRRSLPGGDRWKRQYEHVQRRSRTIASTVANQNETGTQDTGVEARKRADNNDSNHSSGSCTANYVSGAFSQEGPIRAAANCLLDTETPAQKWRSAIEKASKSRPNAPESRNRRFAKRIGTQSATEILAMPATGNEYVYIYYFSQNPLQKLCCWFSRIWNVLVYSAN